MASLTPSPKFDYLEGTTQPDRLNGLDGNDLTLPSLKAWGFLIHRLTFKRYVMKAILKPFNRTKVPIDELNSQ